MDLVYIPEVLTYGSFRSPQYRDFEQPWNQDYFNYGKPAMSVRCPKQQLYYQQEKLSFSKDNCHLCRESKRRSLAAYIRGKTRRNLCQEIHEEEETEEKNIQEDINNKTDDHEEKPHLNDSEKK